MKFDEIRFSLNSRGAPEDSAGVVGAVSVPLDGNALRLEATGEVLACLPSAGRDLVAMDRERVRQSGNG